MENKSHALAAGAFVLVMTALVIALAAWLTRDTTEQRQFELSSRDSVSGLQPQAGVRYKGVSVGRVTYIGLDTATPGNVLVRIAVSENAPITESTYASLGFQGVTGLAFVQLDDPGTSTKPLVAAGEQMPRIPMRPGMMSRLTDQGSNLLGQLEQASQRVNGLLASDNQKTLMVAIDNLGKAAANVGQLTHRADQMLAAQNGPDGMNLPRMVEQAGTTLKTMQATAERLGVSADTVRSSAAEFQRTNRRMNEPGGTLDKIAQSTETMAAAGQTLNATLVPRINRTVDDASRTVRQVGRIADSVNDNPQSLLLGKGAAAPGPGESGFVAPPPAR